MTKIEKCAVGMTLLLVIALASTALNGVDDTLKLFQGLSDIVEGTAQ